MTHAVPRIAAVVVTHDGEQYLEELLASVEAQTQSLDHIVFVDDGSKDATVDIIEAWRRERNFTSSILFSDSKESDLRTRIAGNFGLGLNAVREYDFVALSDQDDIWYLDRIQRQYELLFSDEHISLLAGNAVLIEADGLVTQRTTAVDFEWPNWEDLDPVMQWRAVLARPLVQGGACMLRSEYLERALPFPSTWLHDRWLSLVAAASGGLVLDASPVLRYRMHAGQSLGARDLGDGASSRLRQALQRGTSLKDALWRIRSIRERINPILRSSGVDRAVTYRDFVELAISHQR